MSKYGKTYVDEAIKDYSKTQDINKDGKVTSDDMYLAYSSTYNSVFCGNEEYTQRGEELAQLQKSVYEKYAGEDGILDVFEYLDALNSEENDQYLNEYYDMRNNYDNSYFNYFNENEDTQSQYDGDSELEEYKYYTNLIGQYGAKSVDNIVKMNGYSEIQEPICDEHDRICEQRKYDGISIRTSIIKAKIIITEFIQLITKEVYALTYGTLPNENNPFTQ